MVWRTILSLVVLTAMVGGCGDDQPAADGPPSEVTGVIIDIEGETISTIEAFTLKDGDSTYEVRIADDVDYSFALSHLHEHLAGAEPVTVELEERGSALYALSIEDA
ncbi:MAG TPA: hypothetical protein VFS18_03970 [Actinomycetota bacterium]|nr:hypothetical protein [Actinomycetota bacterium]